MILQWHEVKAEITRKRISCHTFRHSFATELLHAGKDIRTVQDLPGHADVKTTQIYPHMTGQHFGNAFRAFYKRCSPLDQIAAG